MSKHKFLTSFGTQILVCLYYFIETQIARKYNFKDKQTKKQTKRLNREFDGIIYSLSSGRGHKKLSVISFSFRTKEKPHRGAVRSQAV